MAPQGGTKGKGSDKDKQESSSTSGKDKAPRGKGERYHSKDLETENFFDNLERINTKDSLLKAQAKEQEVHEIEVKSGGTACPPDRDDDILMVLKIKGKGARLAYVGYINLDQGWDGPFPLDTTLGQLLERRRQRMGYRQAREPSEPSSESDDLESSSSSSSSSDDDDQEEAMRGETQGDSDTSDEDEDQQKRRKIEQVCDHEPHAGIVRGLRNRQRLDRVGNVLVPKLKVGDMLYYYNNKTHVGMWCIGVMEFILDTTIADEYLYYNIDPVAQGPTFPKEPCVVISVRGELKNFEMGCVEKGQRTR
jgi:hypothetical protein